MITQLKKTIRNTITKSLNKSYPLSLAWKNYLIQRLVKDQVFVVYTGGKVGSSSLTKSLRDYFKKDFVFHITKLTKEAVDREEKYYMRNPDKEIPDNLFHSKFLYKNLEQLSKTRKIYFFSLVRDPIAAIISGYCENYPYYKKRLTKSEDEILAENIQHILERLNSNKMQSRLNWFDEEFGKALDFDIYSEKFDQAKGYHIYESQNILILKLERLNSVCSSAMNDLLNIPNFVIQNANKAENKPEKLNYFDTYQKVKKSVKVPMETMDKIYNSKYIRYFYQEEEINKFKERWKE